MLQSNYRSQVPYNCPSSPFQIGSIENAMELMKMKGRKSAFFKFILEIFKTLLNYVIIWRRLLHFLVLNFKLKLAINLDI